MKFLGRVSIHNHCHWLLPCVEKFDGTSVVFGQVVKMVPVVAKSSSVVLPLVEQLAKLAF